METPGSGKRAGAAIAAVKVNALIQTGSTADKTDTREPASVTATQQRSDYPDVRCQSRRQKRQNAGEFDSRISCCTGRWFRQILGVDGAPRRERALDALDEIAAGPLMRAAMQTSRRIADTQQPPHAERSCMTRPTPNIADRR
jgi:hypothetical protein